MSLSTELLEIDNSLGYDCQRYHNLCLLSDEILAFISGNFLHFFNVKTRQREIRPSVGGYGFSCITKNPNKQYNYLTLSEYGSGASIFIYKYPEMELISLCQSDETKHYTCVNYNVNGDLLAAQCAGPDSKLTIWKWETSKIIIQSRSIDNCVYSIAFSKYSNRQLVTAGVEHIQFWDFGETFTGLKLTGADGRFGKTDACDIIAVHPMPNETVLTNSEWGNVLVWQDGLIKCEICQKNHQPCHNGKITQIYYNDEKNEVMTIGSDGFIRIWFWDTVNLTNLLDDDERFIEIDPTYEYFIGSDEHCCELLTIIYGGIDNRWYVQDSSGGIWLCDISSDYLEAKCERLFRCHAGEICGLGVSSTTTHVISLGLDGRLYLYDYITGQLVHHHRFPADGRVLWMPTSCEHIVVMGFSDGLIRIAYLNLTGMSASTKDLQVVHLIQVSKPHRAAVCALSADAPETVLLTSSEDKTIFIYHMSKAANGYILLQPSGFIDVPAVVTAFTWNLLDNSKFLIGCKDGGVLELRMPKDLPDTNLSFKWTTVPLKTFIDPHFQSNKSKSYDNTKHSSLKSTTIENQFDEFEGSEILWLHYLNSTTLWISTRNSMKRIGNLFEYDCKKNCIRKITMTDSENIAIHSFCHVHPDYVVFGLENGQIRINKLNQTTLTGFEIITAHDRYSGRVTALNVAHDHNYLFSSGADGNIFSYKFKTEFFAPSSSYEHSNKVDLDHLPNVNDIFDATSRPSLEQEKEKKLLNERRQIANMKKTKMLEIIGSLKIEFNAVKERNRKLPKDLQLTTDDFELDERITEYLQSECNRSLQLVRRKFAYDVEKIKLMKSKIENYLVDNIKCWPIQLLGVKNQKVVTTFRIPKISDEYLAIKSELEERLQNTETDDKTSSTEASERLIDLIESALSTGKQTNHPITATDSLLQNLIIDESTDESKLDIQMKRLMRKYKERKSNETERNRKLLHLYSIAPDPNILDPEDEKLLAAARIAIGSYKLTQSVQQCNTLNKLSALLDIKDEIYNVKDAYNRKVFVAREKKRLLCQYVERKLKILNKIHAKLPQDQIKLIEHIPQINEDLEYAENKFVANRRRSHHQVHETSSKSNQKESERETFFNLIERVLRLTGDSNTRNLTDPFAEELLQIRLKNYVFEQNQILNDIEQRITDFDDEVTNLKESKIDIEIDAKFLECHFLTVYQELLITKDSEKIENDLNDEKMLIKNEKTNYELELCGYKSNLDAHKRNLQRLIDVKADDLQKEISLKLKNTETEDFVDEVCRIKQGANFKALTTVGTASNLPTIPESNNSPDDGGYCDSLQLEDQRTLIENQIENENSQIATIGNDIRGIIDKIGLVDRKLTDKQKEIDKITELKQNLLKEIETVIILKLDQMQYFTNGGEFFDTESTVLVNDNTMNNLYQRINQLKMETIEEQRKRRIYSLHLTRIKTDCKFMKTQTIRLKEDLQNAMIKKFGTTVDLNEMEESILRRLLISKKMNVDSIDEEYKKKSNKLKKKLEHTEIELLKVKKERIEKLNVLTVLQEEQNILEEELRNQAKFEEKLKLKSDENLEQIYDLDKLKEISQQQEEQLKLLKKEIQTLRLKAKPFDESMFLYDVHRIPHQISPMFDLSYSSRSSSGSSKASAEQSIDKSSREVQCIVEKFLIKHCSMHIKLNILREYEKKISNYLIQIMNDYETEQLNSFAHCAVENMKSLLPKKLLRYIQTKNFAHLFSDVLDVFSDKENANFNADELLQSIFDEIVDRVPKNSENFSRKFLFEYLQDAIGVIHFEDIDESETSRKIEVIARCFSVVTEFKTSEVDVAQLMTEIINISAQLGKFDENWEETILLFIETLFSQINDLRDK